MLTCRVRFSTYQEVPSPFAQQLSALRLIPRRSVPALRHIVVQWPRFGPYHLARLRAAHAHLSAEGVVLTGLETASADAAYAWNTVAKPVGWNYCCAFPGRDYRAIPPREMEARVMAVLDEINPDAVAIHTYSLPDSRACLRWCRKHRRTAVLMTDSRYADAARSPWWEKLKSRIIVQYDAALAAGTDATAYVVRLGMPQSRVFTGYDVVDNDAFAAAADVVRAQPEKWRALPGLASPEPFFACVSRFLDLKNLDGLLRAYAAYRQRAAHPWRLILVGDGPERPALERLLASESISGVTLTGFMQMDALPAYYALARVLVHPAHKDTWGLVVNEAMACGLPVLVSRETGCVTDLVREGENGFIFPSADEAALRDLLVQVSSRPEALLELGVQSKRIIENWNLDRFARSLLDAVQAGLSQAQRGLSPDVALLYTTLRWLARTPEAFHRVSA